MCNSVDDCLVQATLDNVEASVQDLLDALENIPPEFEMTPEFLRLRSNADLAITVLTAVRKIR